MKNFFIQFSIFLFLNSFSSLYSQCNNFTNSISLPVSGTTNQCNDLLPSGAATICADFNVSFSSGNASFYWGYTVTNNGVSTTTTKGAVNTSQSGSFPDIVCVPVPCGASITFFITAHSNPNGGGSVCNGANASITTAPFISLPIILTSFYITKSDKFAKIFWQTSAETNNDYFTIERSEDGRSFDEVVEIKGAGNSSKEISYEFTDEKPLPSINFYRIKQTDFDGKYSYSEIKSLRFKGIGNVTVTPRTTEGSLNITTDMENYTIAIYNVTGQEVKNMTNMSLDQSLNIDVLQAGVYFVKVGNESASETVRILKI